MLALTVEESIRRALLTDPDIQVKALSAVLSQATRITAEGAYDFTLSGSLNRYKSRNAAFSTSPFSGFGKTGLVTSASDGATYLVQLAQPFVTGTIVKLKYTDARSRVDNSFALNPSYTPTYTFEITQPILRGFDRAANTADIERARHSELAARFGFEKSASDLVLSVINAYWEYVFALGDLKAKQEAVRTAADQVNISEELKKFGRAKELDVDVAKAGLARTREAVIVARTALGNRRDDLLALIMPTDQADAWDVDLVALEVPGDPAQITFPKVGATTEAALSRRAEMKQYEANLEAGLLSILKAENGLLPQLDLTGSYGIEGLGKDPDLAYEALGDGDFYTFALGLSLSFPVQNRVGFGGIGTAFAQQDQLILQKKSQARTIVKDVRTSVRSLKGASERIGATEVSVAASKKSLAAETSLFSPHPQHVRWRPAMPPDGYRHSRKPTPRCRSRA